MKYFLLAIITVFWLRSSEAQNDPRYKNDPKPRYVPDTGKPIPAPTPNIGPPPMPEDRTPAPANGKYAVMTFAKREHDFGVINQGAKVYYNFKFTNTGRSNLIISNAVGSCGCTIPEYPKAPIAPGQSGVIKVSFNSAGKAGQQHKTITIACNTKGKKEILNITANVKEKSL